MSLVDWLTNKKNIAAYMSVIGAVGAIVTLILMVLRQRSFDQVILQKILKTEKDINVVKQDLRNFELSQCSAPHVVSNPQLLALLQCPLPVTEMPNTAQTTMATVAIGPPQPIRTMGGVGASTQSSTAFPTVDTFSPHMPNYGYFGASPAVIGMPAFM